MPARAVADRPDVVVGVRDWQRIGRARFAPVQVFWTGDAFDQPVLEGLGDAAGRPEIDFFMLQSDWHAATFRAQHKVPALGDRAHRGSVPPHHRPRVHPGR